MSMAVDLPAVEVQPTSPPSAPHRPVRLAKAAMLKIVKMFRAAAEFTYELLTGPF
jgi:hypothetical protein